jgi:hypothetical protein
MKALITLMLTVCTAMAQIPDPNDTNYWGNGSASTNVGKAQLPQDGAIKVVEMTGETIEWWNFRHRVFTVEWRAKLTDGSWITVGEGISSFEHQCPEGFYRVIAQDTTAVFPVWNSGTINTSGESNMIWEASTDADWVVLDCINTNLPPEWGEGYVVVTAIGEATNGTEAIITITCDGQIKQCTAICKGE